MDFQELIMQWCAPTDKPPFTMDHGFVIAYFFHEVLIGTWEQSAAHFIHDPAWEKLMELHIFNEEAEFRAIYSQDYPSEDGAAAAGKWLTRNCVDERCEEKNVNWFDEESWIIGNRNTPNGSEQGFTHVDEAGRRIALPKQALGKRLKVRNYMNDVLVDDREGLPMLKALRFVDYRFVGFVL